MAAENSFVQPAIPKFDGYYDHWSMLMKTSFAQKNIGAWWRMVFLLQLKELK